VIRRAVRHHSFRPSGRVLLRRLASLPLAFGGLSPYPSPFGERYLPPSKLGD
jgi:hypothetical protein